MAPTLWSLTGPAFEEKIIIIIIIITHQVLLRIGITEV